MASVLATVSVFYLKDVRIHTFDDNWPVFKVDLWIADRNIYMDIWIRLIYGKRFVKENFILMCIKALSDNVEQARS